MIFSQAEPFLAQGTNLAPKILRSAQDDKGCAQNARRSAYAEKRTKGAKLLGFKVPPRSRFVKRQ